MDLPSKNMYDTFRDQIWKELEPLDPDWFEALTAQASTNEGNVSDQDDLCANQEGDFKIPFDRTDRTEPFDRTADSQLFSTPKVFRHARVVSPKTDELSFTAEQEKETSPWAATQSPYLLGTSKEGVQGAKFSGIQPQDIFEGLHTPQKSPVSFAKRISESLGAEIHPDISWTSSLNTPPALASTLILTKPDESPLPVSVCADQNVVFVRKLFPSLSNASSFEVVQPKHNDMASDYQGVMSPEAAQNPESHDSTQGSLNQGDCVWRQKLPDAIEDGEVRTTVANVLDGAEDVLSIFFTNSSSALRKVKTDRIKRKQIIPTKEHGCSSTDLSGTNNAASTEQRTADQEPARLPSPIPAETEDKGITQWSPLSLSEILPSIQDISCCENTPKEVENSIVTEQLTDSDAGQLVRSHMKITDSGFIKKKRKFVYPVKTSVPQVQREETQSQRTNTSQGQEVNVKQVVEAPVKAGCCSISEDDMQNMRNLAEENVPLSEEVKVLDFDISQLARDFAQDFTQFPDSAKPSKVAEDPPQNGFSPSACLSAMKRANQKARQANLFQDCDGVSNRRSVSSTNQSISINEGPVSDSGFQSAVADITHMTASSFVLSSSENKRQSQPWTDVKTNFQRSTPFPAANKGNGKACLDDCLKESETDAKLCSAIRESQPLDVGRESDLHTESILAQLPSSAKGTSDNCIPPNCQVHGSLPEKPTVSLPSIHASGFKTASNKSIQISSATLERAKHFFEETEEERAFCNQPIECVRSTKDELSLSHGSVKNTTTFSNQPLSSTEIAVDNSCQLTASQKADVTELCTLLEEADSQFEFTQFKTAKLKQQCQDNASSPQKHDKEFDPDFLAGIDFDDSFSLDAEKHPVKVLHDKVPVVSDGKTNCKTSSVTSKSTILLPSSAFKKENPSTKDVSSSSKHISEGSSNNMSTEIIKLNTAGPTETSKMKDKNPLMLGVGFKTAGGNVLRVSEKCLSKARALFADLEENLVTRQKTLYKQISETELQPQHKSSVDNHTGNFLHHKEEREKVIYSDKEVTGTRDEDVTQALSNSVSLHGNSSLTVKDILPPSCASSKDFVSSASNKYNNRSEFSTASGKKVSVSADALKKAECLLNDIHTHEDTNKQLKQMEDATRTGHLSGKIPGSTPKTGGFQTASGKGVTISSAALKKAKVLLNECDKVEHKIHEKLAHFKVPFPSPPPTNGGFLAASGKPVAFSSEALRKAKALFSDISFNAEIPAVSDTSGSGRRNVASHSGNGNNEKNLSKFNQCQSLAVTVAEDSGEKCTEFEDGTVERCENHEKMMQSDEIHKGDFRNTLDSTNTVSSQGNPPSVTKPSLLCTASKNVCYSSTNGLSSSDGFCTASGRKVSVSDDAMTKAKSLFHENASFGDTNNQPEQKVDIVPQLNNGFQTASGKGVTISSAALKKAKSLLSECDEVDVKISQKTAQSKVPVPGPLTTNGGFLAASGKPVSFSSEALQKAKALFGDISMNAEIPAVSETKSSDKKQDNAKDREEIHVGFSTAGGAKVHVSQKNMLKAKNLLKDFGDGFSSEKAIQGADAFFKDCDIMDNNNCMSVENRRNVASHSGNGNNEKNLSKFNQCQSLAVTVAEDSGEKCTEFENGTVERCENHEKMMQSDEIHKGDFRNTLDSTNTVSSQGNPPSVTKPSLLCTASKNVCYSSTNGLSSSDGFCTASGRKVSVSDDAMTKAKSLFHENASFGDTNNQPEQKVDIVPQLNNGFQTSSGKGVTISSAALKKAKSLLSECDEVDVKISHKTAHFKVPVPGPLTTNGGFLAASGKPVAFSSEALQKAKALFGDISMNAEIPAVSETKSSDKKQDNAKDREEIRVGFSTAGGAKVHVSQKNMLKAKNLLKDSANGECHNLNSYSTSSHYTHKSDQSEVKDVKISFNSNLTAASDREDMPPKESSPQVVKSLTSLEATDYENETLRNSSAYCSILIKDKTSTDAFKFKDGNHHNSPGAEESNVLNNDQRSSSEESRVKGTEECSLLNIHSLHLSNCSETQHEFLAQEALECTKALLEDESLAGQRLSMTLENLPVESNQKSSNSCVEVPKGKGKRLVEDTDMSGQPPLKRRLLEEFDRTVDGPKGSRLHQQISSPNGVIKDRRVFKYSTSLFPNITRPHSNGKNYVEGGLQKTPPAQQLTPGNSISAHPKMSTFVPPFLKSVKTESHKNTVLKDNIRTPSAFVPPFKKQRIVVQESSFKPQREEDKPHHTLVTQFNSNPYVPPSQKTQSTTVTGNNSKQDIEMVTLADNTNDSLNNKNISVGCGSEDSFAEASCVEDKSRRQDMFQNLHNVELARDMQDMRIRKKKRQVIRPLPGSLFLIKTSGVSRIPLKAAVHGRCPAQCTQKQLYIHGVHQHVCEITSETAEAFRFSLQQFVKQEAFLEGGGVQLADGGWLIPSNDGTAGKEEFYRALCDTPGVDPKLITEQWSYNHYRWIVWKQASMERSFPETMGSLCLTPEQVLLQLKYRYDVEVDHSRRPALRKIMEKDDTAAKTLVLCVCGVVSRGQSPKRRSLSDTKTPGADARVDSPSAVVWLTDGWYSIKGQLDEPLTAMLHKGRLAVGGKLIINGAQLVGSQDACSPLEAPDSLMLKICANSSRPARWDAKMGYYRDPRPFLLPVSCLYSNGGPVGCVDIIILRSYPIQWMERKPDGSVVFRSVRAEEKEVRRYNSHKQKSMEALFAKIQAEFEKDLKGNNKPKRRRRTITRQDIASLQDGEELYEAVENDPAYLEAHLSEQQLETLHAYRRSQMERKQAELQDRYRRALENAEDQEGSCPKRDVTPVWRLSITDSMDQPGTVYQLNLWRPPSDLESLLKEGCRYKVYNLTTSDGKKHGGGPTVQLSGTKKTQFQDQQTSQEWLSARFQKRVSTYFVDLQNPEFQPLCGEVDLTGYVISIIDGHGSSPAFYLANEKMNFIKVRCFSSLAQSGLEDVVKPRVLLALSNLQLRGQSTSPTPVVFAGDLTVFSTNPKEAHLQESLSQLRSLVQGQANFFLTAEEKLSLLVQSDGRSSISTPALQIRTPISTTDRRQDRKTSVTLQQPVRNPGSFTPVSRNPLATNGSSEKDPVSLKRRRALDYLSRIPSPPPLSNLGSVASPCVKKTFNPPRRSGTPSTLKTVQTPARKPVSSLVEDEWVNDEELAMIDTQALLVGDLK